MQEQLERMLPIVATWGVWILAALIALALLGIWRLGRGRAFLVPARWPGRIASGVLMLAVGVLGGALYGVSGPLRPVLDQVRRIHGVVGKPAGELTFHEVADDSPRRLSDLEGRVVLVNLWATWCPPCRKEMPDLDRLQRDYAERGLVVVTLSSEEREKLLAFAASHPTSTLNVYTASLGWLDVAGRPVSLVIDRGGVVRDLVIGGRDYAEFEALVKKLL